MPRTRTHQGSDITRRKHVASPDWHGSDQRAAAVILVGVAASARSSLLVPVAVVIFALGVIALVAVFALYVSGHRDLPLWLNGSAGVLGPLGLALALVGLVRETRARR